MTSATSLAALGMLCGIACQAASPTGRAELSVRERLCLVAVGLYYLARYNLARAARRKSMRLFGNGGLP